MNANELIQKLQNIYNILIDINIEHKIFCEFKIDELQNIKNNLYHLLPVIQYCYRIIDDVLDEEYKRTSEEK